MIRRTEPLRCRSTMVRGERLHTDQAVFRAALPHPVGAPGVADDPVPAQQPKTALIAQSLQQWTAWPNLTTAGAADRQEHRLLGRDSCNQLQQASWQACAQICGTACVLNRVQAELGALT